MSKKNITKQRFYLQFPTQLFLFIVLIFLGFSCGNEGEDKITGKENPPPLVAKAHVDPPAFNADSAYYFLKTQCDFGPRNPGSKAHEKCSSWLENKLNSYGATIYPQRTTLTTYDQKNGFVKISSGNLIPTLKKEFCLWHIGTAVRWQNMKAPVQKEINPY